MNKWLTNKNAIAYYCRSWVKQYLLIVFTLLLTKNMCILNNKFHDGQFQVSQEDVSLFIIHGPYRSLHTIYHV